VTIEGIPDEEGMLIDFVELKGIVGSAVLDRLDHACINDLLEQPTAEIIGAYVFALLDPMISGPRRSLAEVRVWETADCSVTYNRSDFEAGVLRGFVEAASAKVPPEEERI
jgi:6-pyruvoyltetrahydropterin/6-carboxytetrahydropterin synthase